MPTRHEIKEMGWLIEDIEDIEDIEAMASPPAKAKLTPTPFRVLAVTHQHRSPGLRPFWTRYRAVAR